MSDRSAAVIDIGGHLDTIEKFNALVEAIDGEAGTDWESLDDADRIAAALIHAAKEGATATFMDNQATGGHFPTIEGACEKLGLSFKRADDGHYAYSPINVAYRPEFGEFSTAGTIEDGPSICLETLVRWRDAGELDAKINTLVAAFDTPPLTIAPEVLAQLNAKTEAR